MKKLYLYLSLIFVLVLFCLPAESIQANDDFVMSPGSLLAGQKTANHAPGEIIIKIKSNQKLTTQNPKITGITSLDAINQKNQAISIEPIFKNHHNDELAGYYKIRYPQNSDEQAIKNELLKNSSIEKANLNYLAYTTWTPDDTQYPNQWGLSKINSSLAWDHTLGSSSVIIANIDSGIDMDHPDLANKIWTNAGESGGGKETNGLDDDGNGYIDDYQGWDFVSLDYGTPMRCPWPGPTPPAGMDPNCIPDNDPNPEPNGQNEDGYGNADTGQHHGSATAGIAAAATNNTAGIAGVCPNCRVMATRVIDDEGWGSWEQIAQGIVYAVDNGAQIISMSIAGSYDDTAMNEAIHYAYTHGAVLVAAAGNGDQYGIGYNIDPQSYWLTPICNDNYEYADGGENQIIGVAATNSSDVKTTFSNYGKKNVDISAPGQGIHALMNSGGYYNGNFSGTSASTPFVAGVAGLIKSLHPSWNNKLIRDATIDLIQNINSSNPAYPNMLGGRLRADRALDPNERFNSSGSFIKGSGPAIYLLQNGKKRAVYSAEIYFSYVKRWDFATLSDSRLNDYPSGADLFFNEGSIIKSPNGSAIFQVEYPSGTTRAFSSAYIFWDLGYQFDDVLYAPVEILNIHPIGPNITNSSVHTAGSLVKKSTSPAVYLLQGSEANRVKRLITNAQLFESRYRWQDIALASQSELDSYPSGADLSYPDGSIVKGSSPAVYIISYNQKRMFTSASAFEARGYSWNLIRGISDAELNNYPDGEFLN